MERDERFCHRKACNTGRDRGSLRDAAGSAANQNRPVSSADMMTALLPTLAMYWPQGGPPPAHTSESDATIPVTIEHRGNPNALTYNEFRDLAMAMASDAGGPGESPSITYELSDPRADELRRVIEQHRDRQRVRRIRSAVDDLAASAPGRGTTAC
ncbi:hypothetical protein [Nocardia terpenica]|uniref:hypothetical protein n=1 Tax=Nocardia terpenica TaxID=455432 RepID=UPI0012FDE6F4|nr:hypothetical protein [Nocardia terpenica]